MEMYTDEKISKKSFANGKVIEKLLDQIEREYTNYIGQWRLCTIPSLCH